jgi:hypothetical protein
LAQKITATSACTAAMRQARATAAGTMPANRRLSPNSRSASGKATANCGSACNKPRTRNKEKGRMEKAETEVKKAETAAW